MKEKVPIKRHPAIVSFSKDHHYGLLLVWKIRQGLSKIVDPGRISDYVLYFFKEDLQKHFQEEEQFLFCRLSADDPLRMQAEADHQSIFRLVNEISKKKDDKMLLNRLADELEKHIRFEERQLFNHLQERIPGDELEEIAERLSTGSNAIDEAWKDPFWIAKMT